jgi:hypothetical protein
VQVSEGEGWRLVVDLTRDGFCVLVAGDSWAFELTASEARALQQLASELQRQLASLVDQLMPEEQIGLELERDLEPGSLWMELEGQPSCWCLRFVLTPAPGGRSVEGGWSEQASPAIAAALADLMLPSPI